MAYVFNKEMSVSLGGTEEKILINAGFFSFHTKTSPLHQHHYTEVHMFESGCGVYTTPSQRFTVGAGDMLCLPAGCFHSCSYLEEGARHIDFQTTHTIKEATVKKLAPGIVPALFTEITRVGENRSSARLRAYLSLLCAEMDEEDDRPMKVIDDRAFLIHEFLARHYDRDVTLSQIAEFLCLSEKQTGRLIQQHTGHSFKDELTRYRMEAAKLLIATKGHSLAEVAELVGYHSYSGFWKAYNNYKEK